MKLSIIIPVYNTEKYLREYLNSCFDENAPEENYEIICIDDGSTDYSPIILKEYAERHSNLLIVRQANQGVSVARNHGITIARGDWLWFVDSDDYIGKSAISELLEIVSSPENSTKESVEFPVGVFCDTESQNYCAKMLPGCIFSKLFLRKTLLDNNIFFFEKMSYGEDEMFNFVYRAHIQESLVLENKIFYFYRTNRAGSAMASFDFRKRFQSFETICVWLKSESAEKVFKSYAYRLHLYFYYINTILTELLEQKRVIKSLYRLKKKGILKIEAMGVADERSHSLFFKLQKNQSFVFSPQKFIKKRAIAISQFLKRKILKKQ
ncbi:MAG: glycosyltransferase [Clostridia bacterium]|nr:glycosyltransferase [Clostridia bacterium]